MANCKICGSEFQGESDYCDNCLEEKKDHSSESYLDSLLKSMVNKPNSNQHANVNKKITSKSDTTNEKSEIEYNEEQEDNNLENRKQTSDEQEQLKDDVEDILALVEENQDILALEENRNEDSQEEDNASLASDFSTMNEADDDLVALLSMITGLEESANESKQADVLTLGEKADERSQEPIKSESGDITKSFKSTDFHEDTDNSTDQVEDIDDNDLLNDILSIDNLFGEDPIQSGADKNPEDLGEVFSDSLSAINVLKDQVKNEDFNEEDISQLSQTENREEVKKKKWAKIFGSVSKEAKGTEEVKKKPKKKEKVKKSKKNKSKEKALATNKDNSNMEEELDIKKTAKGKKEKKVKDKKDAKIKKENAKKKNASKKTNSLTNEVMEEEDTGKISKTGTSLALFFCGLVATIIIVGTNLYTYSLNIRKAKTDFERQRYTDAYYEIYGYKVKPNDMKLYDKIMTVMYVNKQLNSYYNYVGLNKQPEALDSLLKGLARYEEVIDTAVSLGIKEDMDSLKSQILVELENKYNIKEKEALAITFTEDKDEYTKYILNAVAENTN